MLFFTDVIKKSMNDNQTPNVKQKFFWSGKGGDAWVQRQYELDITLAPLGEAALSKIDLTSCKHVLDVGCGTGRTTLDIATQLPVNSRVTGMDISVPMLEQAKSLATDEKVANIDFTMQDVQLEPLATNKYDAAFSRFGVMFFDDPKKAFLNIFNSLQKEAALAFVCWQSPANNPWYGASANVLKKYLDLPVPIKRAPSPFAFQEPEYIEEILTIAGFQNIKVEPLIMPILWFANQNLDEAISNSMSLNPIIAEIIMSVKQDVRDNITKSLAEAFSPHMTEEGLLFDSATWIVSAKKD